MMTGNEINPRHRSIDIYTEQKLLETLFPILDNKAALLVSDASLSNAACYYSASSKV